MWISTILNLYTTLPSNHSQLLGKLTQIKLHLIRLLKYLEESNKNVLKLKSSFLRNLIRKNITYWQL